MRWAEKIARIGGIKWYSDSDRNPKKKSSRPENERPANMSEQLFASDRTPPFELIFAPTTRPTLEPVPAFYPVDTGVFLER
jgi:hypothetical protein